MNDAVSNAILAAQNAASQVPAVQQTAGAVAPLPAGRPRTLADAVATAGNAVDDYLKVDKSGMSIGDDAQTFEKLEGTIKLAEAKFPYMVRYAAGGTQVYLKSYDGIREVRSGKAWSDAVAEACRIDPKCQGQYDAIEFVFTLTKDVKGKGDKVWPAGTRLGHTTSITGTKFVMGWVTSAAQRGANDNEQPVQLEHKPMAKGQNKWGVIVPQDLAA